MKLFTLKSLKTLCPSSWGHHFHPLRPDTQLFLEYCMSMSSTILFSPDYQGGIFENIFLIHSSNYCVGFLSLLCFSLLSTPCFCVISSANTKSTTICLLMTHRYTSLLQTNLLMSKLKSQPASLTSPHVYVAIISSSLWKKQTAYPVPYIKPFFLSQLAQNTSRESNLSPSPYIKSL